MTDKTINEVQDEIIDDFSMLDGDMESTIFYIMELGNQLPTLDEKYYQSDNLVRGCQSKVWLNSSIKDGKVHFDADSNTDITKGLITLLIKIWNDRSPDEILDTDLYFIDKIGMNRVIGSKRSNGFASMIKQMKLYALGFKQKENMGYQA